MYDNLDRIQPVDVAAGMTSPAEAHRGADTGLFSSGCAPVAGSAMTGEGVALFSSGCAARGGLGHEGAATEAFSSGC